MRRGNADDSSQICRSKCYNDPHLINRLPHKKMHETAYNATVSLPAWTRFSKRIAAACQSLCLAFFWNPQARSLDLYMRDLSGEGSKNVIYPMFRGSLRSSETMFCSHSRYNICERHLSPNIQVTYVVFVSLPLHRSGRLRP
jgi:hypothetical protein